MSTNIDQRGDGSLIVREIEGEIVVLDTSSNFVHQLNRTASMIWRMQAEGASAEEIASALTCEFAVDEATAQSDVEETLCSLRALKLLPAPRVF